MIKAYRQFFAQLTIDKVFAYSQLMRFDRPIGILLLLWPTLWALWIAAGGFPDAKNFLVFCLGVVVMRSAGCVINDYADRDFDGHVERTRQRPIPAGLVQPSEALVLFSLLLFVALLLVLMLNIKTIILAFIAATLTLVYPFAKRYTWFPQAVLGMAFSSAIPMAFSAEGQPLSEMVWLIFFTNLIWILVYDTIYAMVDRDDDIKVGIRSTAILFGDADKLLIGLMQIMVVIGLVIIGAELNFGLIYFSAIGLVIGLFLWQQWLIRKRIPENCFQAFLNNNYVGVVVFMGILMEYLELWV
ncbi:MAG: 4-hydroxybenzoate octaprenyltransferase [Gammaproteobacteria bacterium]|nr:MAG: 4-hydroxybenzoate octaprenyltransferase [Gammaproteobacteria bacterium]